MTSVMETIAPPNSLMASMELYGLIVTLVQLGMDASTTTMASSTTIAMASTMAERVSKLITEANQFQYKEGGNQRHGNGDGGNQRGAHILQEDIH